MIPGKWNRLMARWKWMMFLPFVFVFFSGCEDEKNLVTEYYIYCHPDSLQYIYDNFKEDIYIPVEIKTKAGKRSTAQLRLRGDSSREMKKKSLKLKLDNAWENGNEANDRGGQVLNLNAEFLDKTYLRQHLSALIMHECGQKSFQTRHVAVYLNDEFYGLYLEVENIDDQWMDRNNLDSTSNLYKAAKDGACLSTRDNLKVNWEKKTNKKSSWYDLAGLIDEVQHLDSNDCKSFLQKHFEYDELINLLALNTYLCNGSTYYHNYYLYHDLWSDGKWKMMPWDLDKTLSYYNWKSLYEISGEWTGDNVLMEKVFRTPSVMKDVMSRMNAIDEKVQSLNLEKEIDALVASLEPYLAKDLRDDVKDVSEWKSKVNEQKEFLKNTLAKRKESIIESLSLFDVVPLDRTASKQPTLNWQRCSDPQGGVVSYEGLWVKYDHRWQADSAMKFLTLDTSFQLPFPLNAGKYLWRVVASNGERTMTGFNSTNLIEVVDATAFKKTGRKTILQKYLSPFVISDSTTVEANEELMIEPGVEIFLAKDVALTIKGKITCSGKQDAPVLFRASEPIGGKEGLVIQNNSQNSFSNVSFVEVRFNYHYCNVQLDSCHFEMHSTDLGRVGRASIIWGEHGNFVLKNSVMKGNRTGEGINVHRGTAHIIGNSIVRCPDSIELISMHDSFISENYVAHSPDDAVDINDGRNIQIENNYFESNRDKAVSIGVDHTGKSLAIYLKKNTIRNNKVGIEVKDSSEAFVIENVFLDNEKAIVLARRDSSYKKGGYAVIDNNILLSQHGEPLIECDSLSDYTKGENQPSSFDEVAMKKAADQFFEVGFSAIATETIKMVAIENNTGIAIGSDGFAPIHLGGWKIGIAEVLKEEVQIPAGMQIRHGESIMVFSSQPKGKAIEYPFIVWPALKNLEVAHLELRNPRGEVKRSFSVQMKNYMQ